MIAALTTGQSANIWWQLGTEGLLHEALRPIIRNGVGAHNSTLQPSAVQDLHLRRYTRTQWRRHS